MSFAKLRAFQLNLYNIPLVGEFLGRRANSRGDNGSEGMGAQCKGLGTYLVMVRLQDIS